MGMFDYFKILESGNNKEEKPEHPFKCAAGHSQHTYQSKALGCNMDCYYILNRRLYKGGYEEQADVVNKIWDDGITLARQRDAKFEPITETINIYAHCPECDPVYTETDLTSAYHSLHGHQPWIEYILTFEKGILTRVSPNRVETREDVKKKLIRLGSLPLPDDDRMVKRTIEQYRSKAKSYLND